MYGWKDIPYGLPVIRHEKLLRHFVTPWQRFEDMDVFLQRVLKFKSFLALKEMGALLPCDCLPL